MSTLNQRNKAKARDYWTWADTAPVATLERDAAQAFGAGFLWQGFAPLSDADSLQGMVANYLRPMREAFPDLRRDIHIVMGGVSDGQAKGGGDGRHWVGGTGYLCGTQIWDLWGIPARNLPLRLRWGEFIEFDEAGQIIRIELLIDVIDWLEQLSLSPLPPSSGVPFVYPAPTGSDGQLWDDQGAATDLLSFARQFIFGGLNAFDEADLTSMGMADYFHPNLKWYGPGGIGACLSLKEFEDLHQRPWLTAFPDRKVGNLSNLIAEGDFVGASSLPGVWLTHTGPYLGHGPSQQRAGVNGIDFWRFENGQFTENWVFVDMIHLFSQLGVDLMTRVTHMAGTKS